MLCFTLDANMNIFYLSSVLLSIIPTFIPLDPNNGDVYNIYNSLKEERNQICALVGILLMLSFVFEAFLDKVSFVAPYSCKISEVKSCSFFWIMFPNAIILLMIKYDVTIVHQFLCCLLHAQVIIAIYIFHNYLLLFDKKAFNSIASRIVFLLKVFSVIIHSFAIASYGNSKFALGILSLLCYSIACCGEISFLIALKYHSKIPEDFRYLSLESYLYFSGLLNLYLFSIGLLLVTSLYHALPYSYSANLLIFLMSMEIFCSLIFLILENRCARYDAMKNKVSILINILNVKK